MVPFVMSLGTFAVTADPMTRPAYRFSCIKIRREYFASFLAFYSRVSNWFTPASFILQFRRRRHIFSTPPSLYYCTIPGNFSSCRENAEA